MVDWVLIILASLVGAALLSAIVRVEMRKVLREELQSSDFAKKVAKEILDTPFSDFYGKKANE